MPRFCSPCLKASISGAHRHKSDRGARQCFSARACLGSHASIPGTHIVGGPDESLQRFGEFL
jgi:hypothetical protein